LAGAVAGVELTLVNELSEGLLIGFLPLGLPYRLLIPLQATGQQLTLNLLGCPRNAAGGIDILNPK